MKVLTPVIPWSNITIIIRLKCPTLKIKSFTMIHRIKLLLFAFVLAKDKVQFLEFFCYQKWAKSIYKPTSKTILTLNTWVCQKPICIFQSTDSSLHFSKTACTRLNVARWTFRSWRPWRSAGSLWTWWTRLRILRFPLTCQQLFCCESVAAQSDDAKIYW